MLYPPENPADAAIASFSAFWVVPFISLVLAALFPALSAACYAGLVGQP